MDFLTCTVPSWRTKPPLFFRDITAWSKSWNGDISHSDHTIAYCEVGRCESFETFTQDWHVRNERNIPYTRKQILISATHTGNTYMYLIYFKNILESPLDYSLYDTAIPPGSFTIQSVMYRFTYATIPLTCKRPGVLASDKRNIPRYVKGPFSQTHGLCNSGSLAGVVNDDRLK